MLHRPIIGLVFLLCVTSAFAEEPATNPSAAPNPNAPQATPGDHWTYELKDEISGEIKLRRTDTVTDVSNNQITVRFDVAGSNRTGAIIYDNAWNVLHNEPFKYSPNDGTGFGSR